MANPDHLLDEVIHVSRAGRRDVRSHHLPQDPRGPRTNNLASAVDAALKVATESEAARFSDILFEDNDVFESGRAMSV